MIPSVYWKNWGRYAEQERLDRRYGRETRSVVILARFPGLCCLCGAAHRERLRNRERRARRWLASPWLPA